MHTVTMRKKDDMTIRLPSINSRLRSAPKSQTHKDRRRLPKVAERQLRKEFCRG